MKAPAICALLLLPALTLAACDGPKPTPDDAGVKAQFHRDDAETKGGVSICMPCVGPHLSFSGKVKFFSMGPGLSF